MHFWQDPSFGGRLIALMAALVLVLQILMVGQRWLVSNIRAFGTQSFLLAAISATIAYFNHAPDLYIVAILTVIFKAIVLPVILERLVNKTEARQEIEPLMNVPISVLVSGLLTLLAYIVAESFHRPQETGAASLGHKTLATAIALFLIGFFMMVNRRKALNQVLGLLSLENGLFLAAISLTYGMPLIVEIGIFFDVLVAAMILAILIGRITETFDSMDVSRLSRLRG